MFRAAPLINDPLGCTHLSSPLRDNQLSVHGSAMQVSQQIKDSTEFPPALYQTSPLLPTGLLPASARSTPLLSLLCARLPRRRIVNISRGVSRETHRCSRGASSVSSNHSDPARGAPPWSARALTRRSARLPARMHLSIYILRYIPEVTVGWGLRAGRTNQPPPFRHVTLLSATPGCRREHVVKGSTSTQRPLQCTVSLRVERRTYVPGESRQGACIFERGRFVDGGNLKFGEGPSFLC